MAAGYYNVIPNECVTNNQNHLNCYIPGNIYFTAKCFTSRYTTVHASLHATSVLRFSYFHSHRIRSSIQPKNTYTRPGEARIRLLSVDDAPFSWQYTGVNVDQIESIASQNQRRRAPTTRCCCCCCRISPRQIQETNDRHQVAAFKGVQRPWTTETTVETRCAGSTV